MYYYNEEDSLVTSKLQVQNNAKSQPFSCKIFEMDTYISVLISKILAEFFFDSHNLIGKYCRSDEFKLSLHILIIHTFLD